MAGKYERKRERKGISRKQLTALVCTVLALVISIAVLHFSADKSNDSSSIADIASNFSITDVSADIAQSKSSTKKENIPNDNTGVFLYSNAHITVYYQKCETEEYCDNIVFYVENNYDKSVALYAETVALDGKNIVVYGSPAIAAHSKGEISISADDRLPTLKPQTITISCKILDNNNYDTITGFDAIDVNIADNSSSKQSNTATSTSLTSGETMSVISDGLNMAAELLEDFKALLDDIKEDSNFNRERAQKYEQQWKKWAEDTDVVLASLGSFKPSDDLTDAWGNLVLLIKDLNQVSCKLSNWDTNNDNLYLADEMTELINECIETASGSTKYMPTIDEGIQAYSQKTDTTSNSSTTVSGGQNTTNSNQSKKEAKDSKNTSNQYNTTPSHKCLECGKAVNAQPRVP